MKTVCFDELKVKLGLISEKQLADIISHVNGLLPLLSGLLKPTRTLVIWFWIVAWAVAQLV